MINPYSLLYLDSYRRVREMLGAGVEPVVILDTLLPVIDRDEEHDPDPAATRAACRRGLADGLAGVPLSADLITFNTSRRDDN
jgi:hypothetical protein